MQRTVTQWIICGRSSKRSGGQDVAESVLARFLRARFCVGGIVEVRLCRLGIRSPSRRPRARAGFSSLRFCYEAAGLVGSGTPEDAELLAFGLVIRLEEVLDFVQEVGVKVGDVIESGVIAGVVRDG